MLSIGLGADTRHASTKSTLSVVCKKKKKEKKFNEVNVKV